MKTYNSIFAVLIIWIISGSIALAQIEFDPIKQVAVTTSVTPSSVPSEGSGLLKVTINLPDKTHITSRDYGFFFVQPDSLSGISWGIPSYPVGVQSEGEEVFRGKVSVSIPFAVADLSPGATVNVKGTLGYQICTEVDPIYCTPPVEREFSGSFVVSEKGAAVSGNITTTNSVDSNLTIEQRAIKALESGSFVALLWIFIGGVLLSFTPCVYPVIPITIAYIGARSEGSRMKGLSLSLVFVLGLGLVYSVLGVVAAATGGVFGLSTQNPWVMGFVTAVFLIMGFGMLGFFDINLPSSFQSKLASHKKSGYIGALFVGGTTGLVAAPCVGPVLIALLSWVSSTGNLFLGFLYLFVFAVGLGSLFIVIGTFAGALSALPQAGEWMETIKKAFGVILVAMAFYFGRSMVDPNLFTLLVGLALLLLSAYWGGFSKLEEEASLGQKFGRGIAVFVLVTGIFYVLLGLMKFEGISLSGGSAIASGEIVAADSKTHSSPVHWIYNDEAAALAQASQSGKPIMIDFWAEWCAACKELDHKTFSKDEVAEAINDGFVPLKIDGTKITDEVKNIWDRYKVKGLPTVLFLTADGQEIERFEAFRTVDEVLPILSQIQNSN